MEVSGFQEDGSAAAMELLLKDLNLGGGAKLDLSHLGGRIGSLLQEQTPLNFLGANAPEGSRWVSILHGMSTLQRELAVAAIEVRCLIEAVKGRAEITSWEQALPEHVHPENNLLAEGALSARQTEFVGELGEALGAPVERAQLSPALLSELVHRFYPNALADRETGMIRRVFDGDRKLFLEGPSAPPLLTLEAGSAPFSSLKNALTDLFPEDYRQLQKTEGLGTSSIVGLMARLDLDCGIAEQEALECYLKGDLFDSESLALFLSVFLARKSPLVLMGKQDELDAATCDLLTKDHSDPWPVIVLQGDTPNGASIARCVSQHVVGMGGTESHCVIAQDLNGAESVQKEFARWERLLRMVLESSLTILTPERVPVMDTLAHDPLPPKTWKAVHRDASDFYAFHAARLKQGDAAQQSLAARIVSLLPAGYPLPDTPLPPDDNISLLEKHVRQWEDLGVPPLGVTWEGPQMESPTEITPLAVNTQGTFEYYLCEGILHRRLKNAAPLNEHRRAFLDRVQRVLGLVIEDPMTLFKPENLDQLGGWEPVPLPVHSGAELLANESLALQPCIFLVDALKTSPDDRERLKRLSELDGFKGLVIFSVDPEEVQDRYLIELRRSMFQKAARDFAQKAVLEADDPTYIESLQTLKGALSVLNGLPSYREVVPALVDAWDQFFRDIDMSPQDWLDPYLAAGERVHREDSVGQFILLHLGPLLEKTIEAADDHQPALAKVVYERIRPLWEFLVKKIGDDGLDPRDTFSDGLAQLGERMARLQVEAIRLNTPSGLLNKAQLGELSGEYHAAADMASFEDAGETGKPLFPHYLGFVRAYMDKNFSECLRIFDFIFDGSSWPYEQRFFDIEVANRLPIVTDHHCMPGHLILSTTQKEVAAKISLMAMEAARQLQKPDAFTRASQVFESLDETELSPYSRANYYREIGHWQVQNEGVERCDVIRARKAYEEAYHILKDRPSSDSKRVDFLNFQSELARVEALQNLTKARSPSANGKKGEHYRNAALASLHGVRVLNQALTAAPHWVYSVSRFQALFRLFATSEEMGPAEYSTLLRSLPYDLPVTELAHSFLDDDVLVTESRQTVDALRRVDPQTALLYARQVYDEELLAPPIENPAITTIRSEWQDFIDSLSQK